MKILIAEDDFLSRNILVSALKSQGHEIYEAPNGQEALDILREKDSPQLAILDWMMPELDGLDVVRSVRESRGGENKYFIIITSKGNKEDVITGLDSGANDYLVKPVDIGELRARIRVAERMVELQDALEDKVIKLENALEHIQTLEGILPICSYCKKIRNDSGYWDQLEIFISEHSDAKFSHSICPNCMQKEFPDYYEKYREDEEKKRKENETSGS